MKVDAIGLGIYTGITQSQSVSAEETGSSPDDFDDTRVAATPPAPAKTVSANPIEQQGSVEDLMNVQASTEKMVRSYGFSSIDQAANMSFDNSTGNSNFALSA